MFYVWPFATLLGPRPDARDAVGDTLGRVGRRGDIAWFTLWQAVVSTVLTIVVGLAPAYVLARYRFAGRRLLASLLTAAFVLPTVVMGAAVLALLPGRARARRAGDPRSPTSMFNLAVVVRTVGAVWEHLPARPRGRRGDARRVAVAGVPRGHAAAAAAGDPRRRRRSCSSSRSRRSA